MIKKLLKALGLYTEEEVQELLKPYTKHLTLTNFKDWMAGNIVPYTKKYNATRTKLINSKPYKVNSDQECHKYLELTNLEEYMEFTKELTKSLTIRTPDELVYKLNLKLNKFIGGKYRTDTEAWGISEYWENSEELFDIIVNKQIGLDCDSIAMFKYHCIKASMISRGLWVDNEWRLREFVVDILSIGKHAMLGWVKEGPNDWIILESTFNPDQFQRIWDNNMTLHNNYMYLILWSFDDKREYRKI